MTMELAGEEVDALLLDNLVVDSAGDFHQQGNPQQLLSADSMNGPTPVKVSLRTPVSAIRGKNGTANRVTPGSSGSLTGRPGGLTMYERSMIQREERERKMKALQEKLMTGCTFTPSREMTRISSNRSVVSSIGPSPSSLGTADMSVFSRLYNAETAASRGWRYAGGTRSRVVSGWNTPKSTMSMSGRTFHSAPASRSGSTPSSPRLEELYKFGEEKLRARQFSDQEEAKQLRERLEERELQKLDVYTFRPRTKWNLAAERRKKAREAVEREADEARRATPKFKKAEREQEKRLHEESELEQCTFSPKTSWNLIEERRKQAALSPLPSSEPRETFFCSRSELERMERDRRYEESEMKECTFKPKTNWEINGSMTDANGTRFSPTDQKFDETFETLKDARQSSLRAHTPPPVIRPEHNVKLVSTDKYQEEAGKNARLPAVVRQNMVRQIVSPKSPVWKNKYRKIGQKADLEAEVLAEGRGIVDARKRGHSVITSLGLDTSKKPSRKQTGQPLDEHEDSLLEALEVLKKAVNGATNDTKDEVVEKKGTPLIDQAHIAQQKLLAEQAMKIRLEQKERAKKQADLERKEEVEALVAKIREQESDRIIVEQEAAAAAVTAKEKIFDKEVEGIAETKAQNVLKERETERAQSEADAESGIDKKSGARKWYDRLAWKQSKKAEDQSGSVDQTSPESSPLDSAESFPEKERRQEEARLIGEEEARQNMEYVRLIKEEEEQRMKQKAEAKQKAEEERLGKEAETKAAAALAQLNAEEERLKLKEEEKLRIEAEAVASEARRKAQEKERLLRLEEKLRVEAEAKRKVDEEERLRLEEGERIEAEAHEAVEAHRKAKEEEELKLEGERFRIEDDTISTAESNQSWINGIDGNVEKDNSAVVDLPTLDTMQVVRPAAEEADSEGGNSKKMVKSDRAQKWKDRISRNKSKGQKQSDVDSEAATVGGDSTDAYPKVLYDDGNQADSKKLPEIGSI